jgi:hypothetical protein
MRWWFALVAVTVFAFAAARAQQAPAPEYIAFRVDDERLIATLLVREPAAPQIRDGFPLRPAARYGYPHVAVPDSWRERPFSVPPQERWVVHVSPGSVIEATAKEVVGGYAGCEEAIGVLLQTDARNAKLLAASPARYFVAAPSDATPRMTAPSPIGPRAVPSSSEWRASIETVLDDLLAHELPRVRSETDAELSKMEASTVGYHRSWARELRRVEIAMERNEGRRQYDIQAFQLGPGAPVYFVRAEWLVDGRQGFAASIWLRTEPTVEVIETNVRPASWLRMFEFQGRVTRDHLGLVLNVLDRDQDGWGEILFLESGYEAFGISLRQYSPTGFERSGPVYGGGC